MQNSYIEKLQADNLRLSADRCTTTAATSPSVAAEIGMSCSEGVTDGATVNLQNDEPGERDNTTEGIPILEQRVLAQDRNVSLGAVYYGSATCTAFATRLSACVRGAHVADSYIGKTAHAVPVYKHPSLSRCLREQYTLPDRAYANMLITVVMKFSGSDYHLIRKKSYMETVERIYRDDEHADSLTICQFYALLALGELWLKKTATLEDGNKIVPGTRFFLQAVALFREDYEEPTIEYVQTLIVLVSFSSTLASYLFRAHTA